MNHCLPSSIVATPLPYTLWNHKITSDWEKAASVVSKSSINSSLDLTVSSTYKASSPSSSSFPSSSTHLFLLLQVTFSPMLLDKRSHSNCKPLFPSTCAMSLAINLFLPTINPPKPFEALQSPLIVMISPSNGIRGPSSLEVTTSSRMTIGCGWWRHRSRFLTVKAEYGLADVNSGDRRQKSARRNVVNDQIYAYHRPSCG